MSVGDKSTATLSIRAEINIRRQDTKRQINEDLAVLGALFDKDLVNMRMKRTNGSNSSRT